MRQKIDFFEDLSLDDSIIGELLVDKDAPSLILDQFRGATDGVVFHQVAENGRMVRAVEDTLGTLEIWETDGGVPALIGKFDQAFSSVKVFIGETDVFAFIVSDETSLFRISPDSVSRIDIEFSISGPPNAVTVGNEIVFDTDDGVFMSDGNAVGNVYAEFNQRNEVDALRHEVGSPD